MKPIEFNPDKLEIAGEKRVLQPFDYVVSRIDLKENEYLLVKLGQHMIPHMNQIKSIIDHVFKRDGDRVLVYVDGDLSFEKVTFQK